MSTETKTDTEVFANGWVAGILSKDPRVTITYYGVDRVEFRIDTLPDRTFEMNAKEVAP